MDFIVAILGYKNAIAIYWAVVMSARLVPMKYCIKYWALPEVLDLIQQCSVGHREQTMEVLWRVKANEKYERTNKPLEEQQIMVESVIIGVDDL